MNITEICIRRPVLAWMIMASTIIFGVVAVTRIGISQFPDVDFPNITVSVTWEGAAPEVMENDVVEVLEEALVQTEGVRSISSSAKQGQANITLELDLSRDVDVALQDVQSKIVAAQRNLPDELDPPVISKSNPEDQPIMWVALSGPFSPQVLSDYVRYRIKERLQTVPSIGEITLGGFLERNVRIWVDAARLDEKGIVVTDIISAIQKEHIELPAGRIETSGREINVRVMGEALDLSSFRKLVVRQTQGGPVYLEDVALVEDGFEDVRRLARVMGAPAQSLGIRKQRGSNAVAVAQGVHRELEKIRQSLPEGMSLQVTFDSTQFIEQSVTDIEHELVLSIVLTALVCWLFLGSLSSTLNVILAIPMSLMGTIAVIYFCGFTLNTFTLLGLGLAVGIVVDDAIMVLENIVRRAEEGSDRVTAAQEGTDEIKFAALAATLAVVAIFLPVVFMGGVIGKFFIQFGVTLCVAVMLSYLEAITLAPARCAQILNISAEHERGRIGRAVDREFERQERIYAKALRWSLSNPRLVLGGAVLLFVASVWVFSRLPGEFVPSQDQSRVLVRLQTAVGSDIWETDSLFKQAEAYVNVQPEVDLAFAVVGGMGGGQVNTGVMFVTLKPPGQRDVTQKEFSARLRKELNSYPGLKAVVQDLSQQGFTAQRGFPLEFSVRGSDWDELVKLSQDVVEELRQSGLVIDLDTDYQLGMPELRVLPDRARAADLGIPVADVATTVNALVGGVRTGKFSTGGRRVDVRLRLLAGQRARPEDLSRLKLRTSGGNLVPLSSLVRTIEQPALQAITRKDRERAITVFANIAPGHSQKEAVAFVEGLRSKMPTGYTLVLGGSSVAFQESMNSLLFALVLGIVVAYMILAAQYNSYLDPVTVLTILPLSVTGAAAALWLAGKSLNIFSMIGLLLLMGLVKKNSIILVDYTKQAREKGMPVLEALYRAGAVRFRPIMMTSITTMMASVPVALQLGAGSEVRAPMAIAVLGGLIVSTVLSLLVVPAFYLVSDDYKERIGKWHTERTARQAAGKAAQEPGAG